MPRENISDACAFLAIFNALSATHPEKLSRKKISCEADAVRVIKSSMLKELQTDHNFPALVEWITGKRCDAATAAKVAREELFGNHTALSKGVPAMFFPMASLFFGVHFKLSGRTLNPYVRRAEQWGGWKDMPAVPIALSIHGGRGHAEFEGTPRPVRRRQARRAQFEQEMKAMKAMDDLALALEQHHSSDSDDDLSFLDQ